MHHWGEAERSAAKCLGQLGRHNDGENRLEEVLRAVPKGAVRSSILRTLASLIEREVVIDAGGSRIETAIDETLFVFPDTDGEIAPELLDQLKDARIRATALLREAVEQPGLSDLDLGIAKLNLGLMLYRMLEDTPGAVEDIRDARRLLLRAGSPHAVLCDKLLENLSSPDEQERGGEG